MGNSDLPPINRSNRAEDFPIILNRGRSSDEAQAIHRRADHFDLKKEREAGMKVADLGRKHGVSEQSIYRWQSKYGGLEVSEAKRLTRV